MLLRLLAHGTPLLAGLVDLTLGGLNLERRAGHAGLGLLARGLSALSPSLGHKLRPDELKTMRFNSVPVDAILKFLERQLAQAEDSPLYERLTRRLNRLINTERVSGEDIRWLLREGGEREPRKVLEQFARWIRRGEMVCYRTGYDFKRGFEKIEIPMAIIFGDLDPLASVESTRSVYRAAQSEYLLWRPVKGNSHIELTMGHDIRQICYDIKNLIEYARTHRSRTPVLPRLR
jgi:pimeloyl-ACP methyl ester carboxylesterase